MLKKIFSAACAAVLAASCLAVTVFAEAAEDERPDIPFEIKDTSLVTTEKGSPSISFDSDDWQKYVHTTPDSDKIGLKLATDKSTYYQGFSLKATASGSTSDLLFNAQFVTDSDNSYVYPEAQEENPSFICPGIELRCEDFGLTCFDGCFLTFYYKIGADADGKLMENSVYVFATDENYNVTLSANTQRLTYDVLMNDNVKQYRSQSIQVKEKMAATRIVFETPVQQNMDSDVLCLDNITITLPAQDGVTQYIKSLDGYNASAKAQETIEGIQIKEKTSSVDIGDAPEKKEGGNNIVVIIIVIVAVVVVGVVVFFIIKKKKQFY